MDVSEQELADAIERREVANGLVHNIEKFIEAKIDERLAIREWKEREGLGQKCVGIAGVTRTCGAITWGRREMLMKEIIDALRTPRDTDAT